MQLIKILYRYCINIFSGHHNLTLCNERYKTLGCEPNYIYIIDVFYGRDNNLKCQPGSHSYCSSNKTENIIRQKCDGKSVCDVSVYPVVLQGSNCGYANPYLRLRYKCRKSGKYERPDGSCEIK